MSKLARPVENHLELKNIVVTFFLAAQLLYCFVTSSLGPGLYTQENMFLQLLQYCCYSSFRETGQARLPGRYTCVHYSLDHVKGNLF